MRIVIFCHSLLSDWNHGNAHFLRGIVTELLSRGIGVTVYEPRGAWSLGNLVSEHGCGPVLKLLSVYPLIRSVSYELGSFDLDRALDGADLVIVHEWNSPDLVRRVGRLRRHGRFRLLFHDTHHRSVTQPDAMGAYDLSEYDGVLAFGEVIRGIYLERRWAGRAWTWHEAADTRVFRPVARHPERDLVWIGNWGDGERTSEIREFLLEPSRELNLRTVAHGVRYPEEALSALSLSGVEYGGWLPNYEVPETFSRYRCTVHVPRRPYATVLPGIPTIRVFEALACGIPLVSAPWDDSEGLFTQGKDYLMARNGSEMKMHLKALLNDPEMRSEISSHGQGTVFKRHTCALRVNELLGIYEELAGGANKITERATA